jgi:hypothetical protein
MNVAEINKSKTNAVKAKYGSLEGKVVEQVRQLTSEEMKDLFWFESAYTTAIVIFFTDGSYIIPSMDAEGNGAGHLIYDK